MEILSHGLQDAHTQPHTHMFWWVVLIFSRDFCGGFGICIFLHAAICLFGLLENIFFAKFTTRRPKERVGGGVGKGKADPEKKKRKKICDMWTSQEGKGKRQQFFLCCCVLCFVLLRSGLVWLGVFFFIFFFLAKAKDVWNNLVTLFSLSPFALRLSLAVCRKCVL